MQNGVIGEVLAHLGSSTAHGLYRASGPLLLIIFRLTKAAGSIAKEKSRDGCLTAPPPDPSHGPSQPTEVRHGMEIIAKKPKHKGT